MLSLTTRHITASCSLLCLSITTMVCKLSPSCETDHRESHQMMSPCVDNSWAPSFHIKWTSASSTDFGLVASNTTQADALVLCTRNVTSLRSSTAPLEAFLTSTEKLSKLVNLKSGSCSESSLDSKSRDERPQHSSCWSCLCVVSSQG